MNKIISVAVFAALMLGFASTASASWWGGGSNNECYGPYGKIPNCNEYDEWDPRYWMEEMEDMMDGDDDNYRGAYNPGYGQPYGGGYAQQPYGGGYGYPQQQQYAPASYYGGGYAYPQQQYAPAPVAPAPQQ